MTVSLNDNNMNNENDNKIFIRINLNIIKKLVELANPHEVSPDLISRVITHCHKCDKWHAEQEKNK